MASNKIDKIAIVGAGGNIGGHIARALLATGTHTLTALQRKDSKSKIPDGIKVVQVDYDDEDDLAAALKGQEFLIITMYARAPTESQLKIIRAAAKAGVPRIMPNWYGMDILDTKLVEESVWGPMAKVAIDEIERLGVSKWTVLACSFWYGMSLAYGEPSFGIDVKAKTAVFFDDGTQKINGSTWPQCGRALAGFLDLKVEPDGPDDKSPCVSNWDNKALYVSSFLVSQRDMLDSVHRAIGTTDADWTITHVNSSDRYFAALEQLKGGDRLGFVRAMYTRVFFPNGGGDYETARGLDNAALGLEEEDFDTVTKEAVKMIESGWRYN